MKLTVLNGWELIESLNNETHQLVGSVCEIKDHNRRRAAMQFMQHKLLTESTKSQTGIFFWAPVGDKWRLETFFDSQFPTTAGEELDHATIWKKWATTILRRNETGASNIAHHYSGLPRGRVTKTIIRSRTDGLTRRVYLILHGDDAPVKNADKLIASRFHLQSGGWRSMFDNHERMTRDDVVAIQRYLGRDLGLLKKAAEFN